MLSFGYAPDTHGGPYGQPEPDAGRSADFAEHWLRESELAEQVGFDGLFVPERHARTECIQRLGEEVLPAMRQQAT